MFQFFVALSHHHHCLEHGHLDSESVNFLSISMKKKIKTFLKYCNNITWPPTLPNAAALNGNFQPIKTIASLTCVYLILYDNKYDFGVLR